MRIKVRSRGELNGKNYPSFDGNHGLGPEGPSCATTPVAGQESIVDVPGTGGIATTIQSRLLLNDRASTSLPPRSLKPLRLSTSPGRYALAVVWSALS